MSKIINLLDIFRYLHAGAFSLVQSTWMVAIRILYFNHCDKIFDLNKTLREQLTEIQKNQPCELIKEAPEFRFNSVFGKRNIYYIFYKNTL